MSECLALHSLLSAAPSLLEPSSPAAVGAAGPLSQPCHGAFPGELHTALLRVPLPHTRRAPSFLSSLHILVSATE